MSLITKGGQSIADADGLRNNSLPGYVVQIGADQFSPGKITGVASQITIGGTASEPTSGTTVGIDPVARTEELVFAFPALGSDKVQAMVVPWACTIKKVTTLVDASGSSTFYVKKSTYANYLTQTDLTGGANVVLSSAAKAQDSTLSGWTTALSAGDILYVTSHTAATSASGSVSIEVLRT